MGRCIDGDPKRKKSLQKGKNTKMMENLKTAFDVNVPLKLYVCQK
jgi:hypothetical protein